MDKQVITTVNGIQIVAVTDESFNTLVPIKPIAATTTHRPTNLQRKQEVLIKYSHNFKV